MEQNKDDVNEIEEKTMKLKEIFNFLSLDQIEELRKQANNIKTITNDAQRGKKRVYSDAFKTEVVTHANQFNNNLLAAKKFKVDESNVRMWRKQLTSPIRLIKIKKKKRQNERPEHIEKIETKLIEWLYDLRAKKQAIAFKDLREKALSIKQQQCPDKLFKASNGWLARLKKRYKVSMRIATHEASTIKLKAVQLIEEFLNAQKELKIKEITDKLKNDDQIKYIYINLDEVPLPLDLSSKRTIEFTRARSISIIKSTRAKSRITLLLVIDSEGNFASPFMIKKGKISFVMLIGVAKEISIDINDIFVSQNKNAWMTADLFLQYLKAVIPEYIKKYKNARFVLSMDHFAGHKDLKILEYLEEKTITYFLIPPGCTGLLQPLDVVVNKPFKDKLREYYKIWKTEELQKLGPFQSLKAPTIETMSKWVRETIINFDKEMIKLSFKKCGINVNPEEKDLISSMLRSQEELSAYFQNNDYLDGIEELADIQTEDELLYEIKVDENIIDNEGSESEMSLEYGE